VFLKHLTLKGFKSFADATTMTLEPGVTVVVGPNGSGKSNVVDAIAWVLGAQAPKSVRSQKMDDVIFAGTEKRPALGPGRGQPHARQLVGPAARRVQRGHPHPHPVPQR
jgi:chromosome segregation protein